MLFLDRIEGIIHCFRASYMKEQNGNYEPYTEPPDEREQKRVTPQRPLGKKKPKCNDNYVAM